MRSATIIRWMSVFLLLSTSAVGIEEEKYKVAPTPDPSSPTKVYIPVDMPQAIAELRNMLSSEMLSEIEALKKEKDLAQYHFGLGLWIRNNWGLWAGSRLSRYFNGIGIQHPDDMSSIILECFWRDLKGKKCNVEKQAKKYRKFWENAQLRQEKEDEKCSIDPELRALEKANPIQNAQESVQKGDLRFLSVLGFSLTVPGIAEGASCLKDLSQIKIIKDTTDGPRCTRHALLQRVARDYAEKYNRLILKNLPDEQAKRCASKNL